MENQKNNNICYKHLFNTLNYQKGHFPPPEPPNEKKYFIYFVELFKNLLHFKYANLFFQEALNKEVYEEFQKIMTTAPHPSNDILIMALSSVTPKVRKKIILHNETDRHYAQETINNSWELFISWYTSSEYGSLTKFHYKFLIEEILCKSLHLVAILEENKKDAYSTVCECNPLLFGMGDQDWTKFIVKILSLLMTNEKDPLQEKKVEYACKVFNLAEQYQFSEPNSAKLYKAWQPPLYRVIPSQLDSNANFSNHDNLIKNNPQDNNGNILWANDFKKKINPILWEWDKIDNVLIDNEIQFAMCEKCGCMGEQAIIENGRYKERATMCLEMNNPKLPPEDSRQLFSFCISLRQKLNDDDAGKDWLPVFNPETNKLNITLIRNLQTAEDFSLLHTVSNFKTSNPAFYWDYQTFFCNCHKNWCLQLRPQNECRNQTVEGKKIKIHGIQKAYYNVSLTGNCGDCKDCFKSDNANDNSVEYTCPVFAFSDRKRCIGCLLCVRHCYRKHGNLTDVETKDGLLEIRTKGLKVTRVLNEKDLPAKVPETKWDCDKERLEAAFKDNPSDISWPKFQYKV